MQWPSSFRARILLAAGPREARRTIAIALRRDGHEIVEFADGATLLAQLRFDVATRYRAEDGCLVFAGEGTSIFTGLGVLRRTTPPSDPGPPACPRWNSGALFARPQFR